jgi:hypothetical protein
MAINAEELGDVERTRKFYDLRAGDLIMMRPESVEDFARDAEALASHGYEYAGTAAEIDRRRQAIQDELGDVATRTTGRFDPADIPVDRLGRRSDLLSGDL